jgi:UDP-glucose 4-epimerase
MKALVTGGCGFIGSHLAEKLLDQGHEVLIVDNLVSGRLANISSFEKHPKLNTVISDIVDRRQIAPLFDGIDWVFHLAGIADIVPSIESPDVYFQNNVVGTLNVLQCAREAGVKRFLYAASSSCYGIPDQYPTPETEPIKPQYPYALTKHMGEELVQHWAKVYKLPALSLRLFNVYGPRSRTTGAYGAVFGVFLAQKLNDKPLTVVGDGQQTRDFTYVTDVAAAFIKAAKSELSGEIFNVGSGNHYSINYLVTLLGGEKICIPKRPGEPDCTFAETIKIQQQLEWAPEVSFEQGVQNMLSVIDAWRDAPVWNASSIDATTKSWFKYLDDKS